MITRFEDWPQRLDAAIDDARSIPFGYAPGENHCCLFTGNIVLAMTGDDPIAWFRGRYKDEKGAYVALKQFAGAGLVEAMERIAAEFPATEIPITHAQRGDVVLFEVQDDPGLGVCVGSKFVSVTKPNGLAFLPMTGVLRAWRV